MTLDQRIAATLKRMNRAHIVSEYMRLRAEYRRLVAHQTTGDKHVRQRLSIND